MFSQESTPPSLDDVLRKMQTLKEEHRPILQQVLEDAGIDVKTRAMLVQHVLEEEDEQFDKLVALRAAGASSDQITQAKGTASSNANAPQRTVGSLRPAYQPSTTLGSSRSSNL